jgi:alpha-1,6-mannosyltransferase
MKFCDITLSYTETSGGIRTYIDAKREYLNRHTDHEHVLIVPGETDETITAGRNTTYRIASPYLPGCKPYRVFWRPDKIKHALDESAPDAVELGSFYVSPWPAFRYRQQHRDAGRNVVVGGYFHSDIADAYVAGPIRNMPHWSDLTDWLEDRLADLAESGAEAYVGSVFERCDVRFAASSVQATRLLEYGVTGYVDVVPLGVDVERFHPSKRSEAKRAELGVAPDETLLMFAGRLDVEKRPLHLVEAVKQLDPSLKARLVLVGEGPLREELEAIDDDRVIVLPYESDPERFATLLASADIYVTAGAHETFGLSVVEAQACGLPVVGVDAGALVERVPEELGRLAQVDDAAAFAAAIEEVLQRREAMGAAARRHVEEKFSWEACFEKWLEVYERAMRSVEKKAAEA